MFLGATEYGLTVIQVLKRAREFLREIQIFMPDQPEVNNAANSIDIVLQDPNLPNPEVSTYERLVAIIQSQDVDLRNITPFPDEEDPDFEEPR